MATSTETTIDVQQWQDWITASGLGPATIEFVAVGGEQALHVTLDSDSPRKARTARRWIGGPLLLADAVLGRYSDADPLRRLHLRGRLLDTEERPGGPLIVTVPYAVATEPAAIRFIDTRIERQDIPRIVTGLVERELATVRNRR